MSADFKPIETIGLTKIFKDFWHRPKVRAVDDVSLALDRGEVFGLLGPNGAGKSTVVKLVLGLLFPTKGKVAVFGHSPRDVRTKKQIGFLPEETYLYPYLSAPETLDLYGRILELPRAERRRRVEALIEMVGLTSARKRVLGEYSKGMARRLGIAQALLGDPELVILDEPTTGLDPIGTREVKDMILDLKRRGKTVLLCSHLLADVEDVCDRIGIMYAGRLQTVGTVEQLLRQTNQTRITSPELSAETVKKIRDVIHRDIGPREVTVEKPMERLENYFLQVVKQAADGRREMTGAGIGGMQTSQIFGGAPGKGQQKTTAQVLAELVKTDPPAGDTPPEPKPATATQPDILKKLIPAETPVPTPQDRQPSTSPDQSQQDNEDLRKSVLDNLLDPSADDNEDS